MREIKFRIYDLKNKAYIEGPDYRWFITRQGVLYNSENDEYNNTELRYIIQQYTGLKDKNGVEIYEGDILKINSYFHGPVYYREGNYKVDKGSGPHYRLHQDSINWKITSEVIGNIHENPELI